ncbi:MAG: response regulator transcription factor [Clostridia bacterium]|nr:MAG: response regulator transcription factor [Clostridia bacterium]
MQWKMLLVDDHILFRQTLELALRLAPDFQVVGAAGNLHEALQLAGQHQPDIALVDLNLDGTLEGYEFIRLARTRQLAMQYLVVTMYDHDEYVLHAAMAGATGFITKNMPYEDLLNAARKVCQGKTYFATPRAREIWNQVPGRHPLLSQRELEVLHLLVEGEKDQEIAEKLFLSVKTIEVHKSNIKKKLGIASTRQAIKFALENKL